MKGFNSGLEELEKEIARIEAEGVEDITWESENQKTESLVTASLPGKKVHEGKQDTEVADKGGWTDIRDIPVEKSSLRPLSRISGDPLAKKGEGRDANIITWDALDTPSLTGYRVYRRELGKGDGDWILICEIDAITKYLDTTIYPDISYEYKITALKGKKEFKCLLSVHIKHVKLAGTIKG